MISRADKTDGIGHSSRLKILLACSHGGHLTEMLQLQEAFEGHDIFYFSYDADTTRRLPNAYLVSNAPLDPIAFVRNLFRLYRIFKKEKPDLVVSTGAEIAIPAFIIAKLLRVPTLYIECGAQVVTPSKTGRIMYWLADTFYVQWPELLEKYGPRAMYRGSLVDQDRCIPGDRSHERRLRVSLVQPAQVGAFSSDQPPMGLGYIATVLEQHGCEVRLVDANAEKLPPQDVVRLLMHQKPDMVCFTLTTPLAPSALDMVQRLRQTGSRAVFVAGGPHATVLPDELLGENQFDYVVRGEGEDTMAELVERVIARKDMEGVLGVSWRKDGGIVHNPNRPLRADLDAFSHPDWSLFPLKRYSSLVRKQDFSLPLTTSRGCPYGCTFCYKGVYGRRLRMRKPEEVVNEWQFLVERYHVREVAVLDDVFTFEPDRAIAICNALVERGLNRIPWSTTNGVRADRASRELFEAMKRAGCYRVYFGIESGAESVVQSLNKGITLEQARTAVQLARDAGLEVGGYFMLGNLGETEEDMNATVRFALDLDLDYAQFSIATPYPGTQMFERIKNEGELLIASWEDLATYGTAVFRHGVLTPELVGRKYRESIRTFYLRPRMVLRQARECFTWVGLKHRLLSAKFLLKLATVGGRKRVTPTRGVR